MHSTSKNIEKEAQKKLTLKDTEKIYEKCAWNDDENKTDFS